MVFKPPLLLSMFNLLVYFILIPKLNWIKQMVVEFNPFNIFLIQLLYNSPSKFHFVLTITITPDLKYQYNKHFFHEF